MLTKENGYLQRGAIIVKPRAVSACASALAGLDKACPRDLERTPRRHPCWAEYSFVESYHNRRKTPNWLGSAYATLPQRWSRIDGEDHVC